MARRLAACCVGLSIVTVLVLPNVAGAAPGGIGGAEATGAAGTAVVAADARRTDFYRYPSEREVISTPVGGVFATEPMQVIEELREASSRALRVKYRSDGVHGRPIAVTGFLLIPKGKTPQGGWPVVAWGHGTSGVGYRCAPSRYPNLYPEPWNRYADFVANLLRDGYAVVGTDYAGLGFPGHLHNYFQLYTLARSMIDSVRAARNVSPKLGRQWFAVGHSEGGQAALGAGELAADRAPDLELLGTVPIAPGGYVANLADTLADARPPFSPDVVSAAAYLGYSAVGANLYAPQRIRYTDLLAPEFAAHMPAVEQLCLGALVAYLQSVDPSISRWANPDWALNQTLQRWTRAIYPAQRHSDVPILVTQGGADIDVLPTLTNQLVGDLCTLGDVVDYRIYPAATHATVLEVAYPAIAAWLAARRNGQPATQTCQPTTDEAVQIHPSSQAR